MENCELVTSHSRRQVARPNDGVQTPGKGLQQGIAAHSRGDLALAEAEYRKLVAEKATTPEVLGRLATICGQTDRQAEALRLWKQAVAADPGSAEAAAGLAGCYERMGRIEQALDGYQRIVRRWPGNVPAR